MGGARIVQPALIDFSKIKGQKVLAIGAHSDDMEFGAGGTLLQMSRENEVTVVIATDGRMGSHDLDHDKGELIQMRMTEARIAGKKLGVKEVLFWGYPDLQLRERKKHLLRRVVKELLRFQPDIVLTFDPWGKYEMAVHPDHRTLAWAVVEGVMMATLPEWVKKHKLGRRFLSPKPSVWLMAPGEPNVAVDVSDVWEERLDLLKVFVSQFDREVQWERLKTRVEYSYGEMGKWAGVAFAEGFRIMEYDGRWDA